MENNVSNNINKKIRKAVRSYLIKDNKVLVIKYNFGLNKDYIDIPGGKIEDGETPEETSIPLPRIRMVRGIIPALALQQRSNTRV